MSDSTTYLNAINLIGMNPSRSFKEEALRELKGDSKLIYILQLTYDPFKQFYIGTVGLERLRKYRLGVVGARDHGIDLEDDAFTLLNELSARSISGEQALLELENLIAKMKPSASDLLLRILKKDMRAGFTENTINKVFGAGTIPDFPYMRCSLPDKSNLAKWVWSDKQPHISQEKADGMFANVNIDDKGVVVMTTRQGTPVPLESLPGLETALSESLSWGTQTHGEVLISENGKLLAREIGNGLLNSVCNGGTPLDNKYRAHYYVWDQIPLSEVKIKAQYRVPYSERLKALAMQLSGEHEADELPTVDLVFTRLVRTYEEAFAHYIEMLDAGKEGTVLKHRDAIWKDGTSKDQVKFKLEVDVDLVVTGIEDADPGSKHAGRPGALVCETSDASLVVRVAIKNEAMRDAVEANKLDWFNRIVVVRANQLMKPSAPGKPHSLFLPRLVEAQYRIDKNEPDSLARVRDQFDAAMKGK